MSSRGAFRGGLLAAALAFGFATAAWSGSDEARAALRRGDFAAALAEFRPLAERGDVLAQFNLAILYHHGLGTARDHAAAIMWYEKAAQQGHFQAQHNLGVMYMTGEGAPRDDVRAYLWFSLAAEKPLATARTNRDIVASRMTAEQIAEAQRLLPEWLARQEP